MEFNFTLDDIKSVAGIFWSVIPEKKVIAFHGDMGAGKTTFIHALCDEKEVSDIVGSPTFSIINEYEGKDGTIYHIDLYRLAGAEEAIRAGVEDCLYSGNTCFVEWPERALALFPDDTIHVYLYVVNEQIRNLRIGDN